VKKSHKVRFVRRTVMLLVATAALAAVSASSALAAESQTFTYAGQGGGDSGTCGPDWANDTYTRVFKVYSQRSVSGTYRVEEKFTNGHFTTLQGPSPESCEAVDHNQVSANVTGNFHGQEVIKVSNGTFSATGAAACGTTCTTAGFIAAAFGNGATYDVSDFYFYYHTGNKAACANTWTNAATGNGGDIATICQP
jgi:hypothetical protein